MTSYSALSFLKTKSKGDAKRRLDKKPKAKSQKLWSSLYTYISLIYQGLTGETIIIWFVFKLFFFKFCLWGEVLKTIDNLNYAGGALSITITVGELRNKLIDVDVVFESFYAKVNAIHCDRFFSFIHKRNVRHS